jgi:hypothetical protein
MFFDDITSFTKKLIDEDRGEIPSTSYITILVRQTLKDKGCPLRIVRISTCR